MLFYTFVCLFLTLCYHCLKTSTCLSFTTGRSELSGLAAPTYDDLLKGLKTPAKEETCYMRKHSADGRRKLSILMVCDFFYPNIGGVESHLFHLACELTDRGHKVCILTHNYSERSGVRYITSGIKVYYYPSATMYRNTTFPIFFGRVITVRDIILRERIDIVHGHQAYSTLQHEVQICARVLGLHTIYTDHSISGFGDSGSIHMNKTMKFTASACDCIIAVSYASKENICLKGHVSPDIVYVIPHGVDTDRFKPNVEQRAWGKEHKGQKWITIVVVSRLVERKGSALLIDVIPQVCEMFEHVRFLIGGDGPMRTSIEEMVGGVPEVLPDDMMILTDRTVESIVKGLNEALEKVANVDPMTLYRRLIEMEYTWKRTARRTEEVMYISMNQPQMTFAEQCRRYGSCGGVMMTIAGIGFLCVVHCTTFLCKYLWPDNETEVCPEYNTVLTLKATTSKTS